VKPPDSVVDDVLMILKVVVWFDDPFLPAPEEKYETLEKKRINYKSF
jgi:hypothetical protein